MLYPRLVNENDLLFMRALDVLHVKTFKLIDMVWGKV